MPISSASSYVPTCQAFVSHWADVNAALPAQEPLTFAGSLIGQTTPVTLAGFTALFDSLKTQRDTVTEALVELELARGSVVTLKRRLILRIAQFIGVVRGNLAGSKYERSLPLLPDLDSTQNVLQAAAVRVRKLWQKIDADPSLGMTLPLTLEGGLPVSEFSSEMVDAIPQVYLELEGASSQLRLEREERNDLQDKIHPVLKAYRQVMPQKFPPGHALTEALPDLSPRPGSTPDPVVATAVWSAPEAQARITWTASSEPTLDHYELRAVPGPEYATEDEVHVLTIAPDAPRECLTAFSLTAPGMAASFKIYVVLTTGHEAGSDPVVAEVPAAD